MSKKRVTTFNQQFKRTSASCHPEKAVYANKLCRSCYEKYLRQINPEYAERQRDNCRQWSKTHKLQKQQIDKVYRAKQDPEWKWAHSLWSNHRITPDQYNAILHQQNGCCAICGKIPTKTRLAVDYDHDMGHIRGLLCFRCNFGLSWFQDNEFLLQKASKHVTHCIQLENLNG